ncbi:MAG: hypothetical protein ACXVGG_14535, partial [Mycobacteriaceae bacterium]
YWSAPGVPASQAVSGKALQALGPAVVLNVILGVDLIAALATHHDTSDHLDTPDPSDDRETSDEPHGPD